MNTSWFIAKRLGSDPSENRFTRLIRRVAITSIALGIAVMIAAVSIVTGFQQEIRGKAIGFGAHIQLTRFDYNLSPESTPVTANQPFLDELQGKHGITHLQSFAHKAGILRTEEEIFGVVFKGVGSDFNWDFFKKNLTEGNIPVFTDTLASNELLLSAHIAQKLSLKTGDDVLMYFIQDPPRIRRFTISGIFETGLEELDKLFVLGHLSHIQRLNNWDSNQVGGFEILVSDYKDIDRALKGILEVLPYDMDARSIRQVYPQLFDWLALLDMNVYVILFLMVLVASINMITTLLISVLEKTRLIGVLKSLGGNNHMIRKVFLINASFVILKGLILGNLLGISLGLLQNRFGIIQLSQESYYVSQVPFNLDPLYIGLINLGTFGICLAMLILPSLLVTRISPVKALLFR